MDTSGRIYGNEISFNVKHEESRRHQQDKRNKIKQSHIQLSELAFNRKDQITTIGNGLEFMRWDA